MAAGPLEHGLKAIHWLGVAGREPIDGVEVAFVRYGCSDVVPAVLHARRNNTGNKHELVVGTSDRTLCNLQQVSGMLNELEGIFSFVRSSTGQMENHQAFTCSEYIYQPQHEEL
jgi:hypothetical protein